MVVIDPPVMMVVLADPPVRLAEPLVIEMQPRDILEVSDPPLILVWPVTFPPVSCVVPLEVRLVSEPPEKFKMPLVVAVLMVPAVIFAVAFDPMERLPRLMEEIKFPPTMMEFPIMLPPERLAVPFVTDSPLSVPPV